jgi:hypothetical protein
MSWYTVGIYTKRVVNVDNASWGLIYERAECAEADDIILHA